MAGATGPASPAGLATCPGHLRLAYMQPPMPGAITRGLAKPGASAGQTERDVMPQKLPGFSLAERLRAGETVYSAWCGLASPLITDVMAREGFNTVTIDQQHGMWDHAATVASI